MTKDTVAALSIEALAVTMKLSLPLLLGALVVGLLVSVFQAVTQVQEMTLTFIPKILVSGAIIVVAGPWMLDQMVAYAHETFLRIGTLGAP